MSITYSLKLIFQMRKAHHFNYESFWPTSIGAVRTAKIYYCREEDISFVITLSELLFLKDLVMEVKKNPSLHIEEGITCT